MFNKSYLSQSAFKSVIFLIATLLNLSINVTISNAQATTDAYSLEYVSGGQQQYPGGWLPQPLVFKIKDKNTGAYVTDLATNNFTFETNSFTDSKLLSSDRGGGTRKLYLDNSNN